MLNFYRKNFSSLSEETSLSKCPVHSSKILSKPVNNKHIPQEFPFLRNDQAELIFWIVEVRSYWFSPLCGNKLVWNLMRKSPLENFEGEHHDIILAGKMCSFRNLSIILLSHLQLSISSALSERPYRIVWLDFSQFSICVSYIIWELCHH